MSRAHDFVQTFFAWVMALASFDFKFIKNSCFSFVLLRKIFQSPDFDKLFLG